MKIVINKCYGGFSISREAFLKLRALGCKSALTETDIGEKYPGGEHIRREGNSFCRDVRRDDPLLVQVVEELGEKANGGAAELKIVEIPDKIEYYIEEYDGLEHIAQKHQKWY